MQTIFWDNDGVLVDTEELAARFGDEQSQAQVQRAMGAEQQTLAKRFGTPAVA